MTPEQLLELEAEMDRFLTNGFNVKHNILQVDEERFLLPDPAPISPGLVLRAIRRTSLRMDHENSRVFCFRSILLQRLKDELTNEHYGIMWLGNPSRWAWVQDGRCGEGCFPVEKGEIEVTCLLQALNRAEVAW